MDWGGGMSNRCPQCGSENPEDTLYCGHCAAPLKPSTKIPIAQTETLRAPGEELTTGSTFAGKYQIIEELGKGGMGRIYKALDTEVNEKVALKLIKPEVALDKETIERFRNELKLARKVRHKNVCQMFDLNSQEGIYYITMEYVSGQDLKGLIRQSGRLAVETAVSIARQVCDGLEEAHGLGIVHRDLKPGNIMVDRDGQARIMDFGIARSLKAKGITGAGGMIGTPEYMSPEQVEGKEVDARADIYSVGVILYEMVTGHVPFEGDTPFTIGVKHKSEIPKNPKEINSQISEDLGGVILRCLEEEKGKKEVLPKKNKMLVVLPFENLGLPEDEYFADGMTDELTNRLSALYGLDVISRASAIQYKKTNKTIRQIKQELDVDYVLTGTVRWDKAPGQKGRVRISPQLIRAQDDTQIWSKTYEQALEDIFAIQTGISEEVVKQLDLTLLEPERQALAA